MEKQTKTIYESEKLTKCPRCRFAVRQRLFDYDRAIYKCTKCGNIHA